MGSRWLLAAEVKQRPIDFDAEIEDFAEIGMVGTAAVVVRVSGPAVCLADVCKRTGMFERTCASMPTRQKELLCARSRACVFLRPRMRGCRCTRSRGVRLARARAHARARRRT